MHHDDESRGVFASLVGPTTHGTFSLSFGDAILYAVTGMHGPSSWPLHAILFMFWFVTRCAFVFVLRLACVGRGSGVGPACVGRASVARSECMSVIRPSICLPSFRLCVCVTRGMLSTSRSYLHYRGECESRASRCSGRAPSFIGVSTQAAETS